MATFSAGAFIISFTVEFESVKENRKGRVAIQEIPGGDDFYVDLAGRTPLTMGFDIVVANATAWGEFTSLLGTQGLLQVEGFDSHQAVLMSLDRSRLYADGQSFASAEFTIVDV